MINGRPSPANMANQHSGAQVWPVSGQPEYLAHKALNVLRQLRRAYAAWQHRSGQGCEYRTCAACAHRSATSTTYLWRPCAASSKQFE